MKFIWSWWFVLTVMFNTAFAICTLYTATNGLKIFIWSVALTCNISYWVAFFVHLSNKMKEQPPITGCVMKFSAIDEMQFDIEVYLMAFWRMETILKKPNNSCRESHEDLLRYCHTKLVSLGVIIEMPTLPIEVEEQEAS